MSNIKYISHFKYHQVLFVTSKKKYLQKCKKTKSSFSSTETLIVIWISRVSSEISQNDVFFVVLDWKTRVKWKYVGRVSVWESTDGSCVLLLVSSYSGPGLNPAPVMLGDGGLPVLTSHSLPQQLIAGRNFEELGWGLQKQAGKNTGNKPLMWRGSLGRRQEFVCESDVRVQMISKRFYPCITSSISFL